MEEIAVLEVLRRHAFMIAALCIIATLTGYGLSFVSFVIPEKYEASATLLVRPHEPIKLEPNNAGKEFLGFPVSQTTEVETASKTYIEIIKSPALIGEVVRELNLDKKAPKQESEDLGIFGRFYDSIEALYEGGQDYLTDAIAIVKYGKLLKDDAFTKAVKQVTKGLELKSYEDTYVFEIQYSSDNPQTAADVANTIGRLFIGFMEKIRSSEAQYSGDRLKSELEQSRERLVEARQVLENYKTSHGVFLYRSEYDAKLKVISDLQIELAKLDENLAGSRGTLAANSYLAERARLVEILNQRRAALAAMPAIERELQLREADVEVAATTYETVAKALKDAEIKSDPVPEARLISPAAVPQLPSRPRRGVIALASLLSGLAAGVILAFFLEYIDRRVRGIREVENFVGLKVIGTIPRVPAGTPL